MLSAEVKRKHVSLQSIFEKKAQDKGRVHRASDSSKPKRKSPCFHTRHNADGSVSYVGKPEAILHDKVIDM